MMTIEKVILFLVGTLLGVVMMAFIVEVQYEHHSEIINKGYGEYNSETGKFQWKVK